MKQRLLTTAPILIVAAIAITGIVAYKMRAGSDVAAGTHSATTINQSTLQPSDAQAPALPIDPKVSDGSNTISAPVKIASATPSRSIVESKAALQSIGDPLERILTGRSADDANWMDENRWPRPEEIKNLVTARDCPITQLANRADGPELAIQGDMHRVNVCIGRFFADGDPRYAQSIDNAISDGSSFAARLQLERILEKPLVGDDQWRAARLAIQTAVLGDPTALDLAMRAEIGRISFDVVQSAYMRALVTRERVSRRDPGAFGRPRPSPPPGE
jgi:hypothetical protein